MIRTIVFWGLHWGPLIKETTKSLSNPYFPKYPDGPPFKKLTYAGKMSNVFIEPFLGGFMSEYMP